MVHFEDSGTGVYVGGEERSEGFYRFRFGEGAGARVERMHLARMEPEQWRMYPGTMEGARVALAAEQRARAARAHRTPVPCHTGAHCMLQ